MITGTDLQLLLEMMVLKHEGLSSEELVYGVGVDTEGCSHLVDEFATAMKNASGRDVTRLHAEELLD